MKHRHGPCLILVALLLLTSALPLTQAQHNSDMTTQCDIELIILEGVFNDFDDAIT